MKKYIPLLYVIIIVAILLVPNCLMAQATGGVQELHGVLEKMYKKMVKLCIPLTDVARAIAGFGALWYIAYRVWKHIANAEAIDFFPLLRPFAIALAINFYPAVLSVLDAVLKPMSVSTAALVKKTNEGVERMLAARAKSITTSNEWESLMGGLGYEDDKDWYKYQQPEEEKKDDGLSVGKALKFSFSLITNTIGFIIKGIISLFLQILYYAAALCIDTLRTFHLLILAILGPFVLCLSVYDGFQHTLPVWLARYINVYLWLPIANLFGAMIGQIQQEMLQIDIDQTNAGDLIGFGPTDIAYIIFLIIAIVGYFTIPSIANYVIHASGASALLSKTNSLVTGGRTMLLSSMGGRFGGGSGSGGSMSGDMQGMDKKMYPMADAANSEPYLKDGGGGYQHNKLSGKS